MTMFRVNLCFSCHAPLQSMHAIRTLSYSQEEKKFSHYEKNESDYHETNERRWNNIYSYQREKVVRDRIKIQAKLNVRPIMHSDRTNIAPWGCRREIQVTNQHRLGWFPNSLMVGKSLAFSRNLKHPWSLLALT